LKLLIFLLNKTCLLLSLIKSMLHGNGKLFMRIGEGKATGVFDQIKTPVLLYEA